MPSDNSNNSWRGSSGVLQTRGNGPIGSVGNKYVYPQPKGDLECDVSPRSSGLSTSNPGGGSGNKTPYGPHTYV
ncbi:hypothetical protein AAHA92_31527 [Salvia divinorum]|uniref:Uncharacterized protein n=1 Tax=Salvia divinorum TaxID=28513 RepID=A0ABD1FQK7_SALDI